MADRLVQTNVDNQLERIGLWGPYWSDESTGIIVFGDNGADLSFARTTNKGASWSTTELVAGVTESIACWYDKETPGDTGTLVHIAWLDSTDDNAYYITVDVSDASVGTQRTIDSTITVSAFPQDQRVAITKAVNGNLLVAFSTQSEIECYRSTDSGANWTDRADVFESGTQEDWCLLFPADVDAGDACALFWDRSASAISVKMYDDSANSWTATAISSSMVAAPNEMHMDGAIRLSDNHLLMMAHSNDDSAGDDLLTWDLTVNSIASPTVTAKTNIFTDQAESAQAAMFIDQQTDDVYAAYLKGGTWLATVDVVYHKSTDGMDVWGTEQAYSESAADDFRIVQAGRTATTAGGRYQPAFYDDDEVDIYVNEVNDIEIAASAATRRYTLTTLGVG